MLLWVSLVLLLGVNLAYWLEISTWSPPKVPCLAKGISAGLWVDLEEAWALAAGLQPAPTCKRDWGATGGHRRDLWLVALLLLLLFFFVGFSLIGGLLLTLRSVLFLTVVGGSLGLRSLFSAPPFGVPLGCLLLTRVVVPSLLRFKGIGRFMMSVSNLCLARNALQLDESLDAGDVSRAWLVWSGAAEVALVDACHFSGGPLPGKGLVLGRGVCFASCRQAWWSQGSDGTWLHC